MKKKCKYCMTVVEFDKKSVKKQEDCGRGAFCPLCGSFISVPLPKKKNPNNEHRNGYYYKNYYKHKKQRTKNKLMFVYATIAIIITMTVVLIMPGPFMFNHDQIKSTFYVYDNSTSYDISTEILISIHVPKHGIEFESESDIHTLSNFYVLNTKFATNLTINLGLFEYSWIEINPNNVHPNYTQKYGLVRDRTNRRFVFYLSVPYTFFI